MDNGKFKTEGDLTPFMSDDLVTLWQGDCLDVLRRLPDESVHCCVTSPPYFGLRDYGTAEWQGGDAECDHKHPDQIRGENPTAMSGQGNGGSGRVVYRDVCGKCGAVRVDSQIGLEETPQAFVAKMVEVFEEVRRVLKPDGVLFLNLGDSYFGSGKGLNGDGTLGKINSAKQRSNRGSLLSNVGRATACDTFGKALEDFRESDCLCQSLCDACRKAYQIGKSHSGIPHAPKQSASLSETIHEHKELQPDHLPTSGFFHPANHNVDAIQDSENWPSHVAEQLLASHQSTLEQSSQPLQGVHLPDGGSLVCLMCEQTLTHDDRQSVHTKACTCDIVTPLGALNLDRSGIASSGLAYPHYTTTSLKPKDLIGIPWRVAFALQEAGWWLRQDIIWSKPNPMPESVTDRCTKAHEYIFLLTKSARYFYDGEAVKEKVADATVDRAKYHWASPGSKAAGYQELNGLNRDVPYADVVDLNGRNKRSVWTVTTQPYSEAHFATFPPKLIEPCILAGTSEKGVCAACGSPWVRVVEKSGGIDRDRSIPEGLPDTMNGHGKHQLSGPKFAAHKALNPDIYLGWRKTCKCDTDDTVPATVLDPFAGAGTTMLVAKRQGRKSIGIELNPEYCGIIERRLEHYHKPSPPKQVERSLVGTLFEGMDT